MGIRATRGFLRRNDLHHQDLKYHRAIQGEKLKNVARRPCLRVMLRGSISMNTTNYRECCNKALITSASGRALVGLSVVRHATC